jgi:dTDP-4-amino-4,6-dideoxygalactose transaminase
MLDVANLSVDANTSLRQALDRLDRTAEGVLLLVDRNGRLLRTVTDGDVRRLLLGGASLDAKLSKLPARTPITASEAVTSVEALASMNERVIDHLPVVDAQGRPVEMMLRRELDRQILLSTPHLSEHEVGFVEEAFRSNWIAPLGPNVDAFERELAAHVGVAHAAAVSSGTAALHLALRLLGVEAGDVVFCSSLTFVASVNPVLYEGAKPVFIDSDPETWNMSPAVLERALEDADRAGRLPKAAIVVNLYGQSADMDPILALCERFGVTLIEDAAESLGASYRGRPSGSFGKLGVFSFNGNKIITTSGGGMLVSEDPALIEKARFLSTQSRDPAPWYQHSEIGYNYRMSNVLAGIGRGQLRVLENRVAARRAVFERYRDALAPFEEIRWMPEAPFGRATRWLSVCLLDAARSGIGPAEFIGALSRSGIEARRVWKPMHQQPLFEGCSYYPLEEGRSFADTAFAQGVCLPSGSNLTPAEQDRILRAIEQIFDRARRRIGAAVQ